MGEFDATRPFSSRFTVLRVKALGATLLATQTDGLPEAFTASRCIYMLLLIEYLPPISATFWPAFASLSIYISWVSLNRYF